MQSQRPLVLIDLGVREDDLRRLGRPRQNDPRSRPRRRSRGVDLASRSAVVRAREGVDGAVLAAAVRAAGPPAGHRDNAFVRGR